MAYYSTSAGFTAHRRMSNLSCGVEYRASLVRGVGSCAYLSMADNSFAECRARSSHGMGNLRRRIRDAACTVLLLGRLQRAGRQLPMVQESRHANVVRVRGSTRFLWLAGTDCGLYELCGSWIFLGQGMQTAEDARAWFSFARAQLPFFRVRGIYLHSRYAESLDLF
jgi:hypothetical protein